MSLTIGVLHPGEMGAAVGASYAALGHRVVWASEGRSPQSCARAVASGLEDVGTVADVSAAADLVISVVPPGHARAVARQVSQEGVVVLDANAVSPAEALEVGRVIESAGGTWVDGSIVGPPPHKPDTTRLFLAGPHAQHWRDRLTGGLLEHVALDGGGPGAASTVKMLYAGWTKGTHALLLALAAAAEELGVREALGEEWARSQPALVERLPASAASALRKGWRWDGEMEYVAATLESAGLPSGFHRAAAEIFSRLPRSPEAEVDSEAVAHVVQALLVAEGWSGRP